MTESESFETLIHISQAVRHDISDDISHHLCLDLWHL